MFLSEEKASPLINVDIVGQRPLISRELIGRMQTMYSTDHGNDVMVVIIYVVPLEF